MIDIETALGKILSHVRPLPEETVALRAAHGRVLARAVRAAADLPSFDNAAMDGYAVRAADLRSVPRALSVRAVIRAGSPSLRALGAGDAMKIMTGAPMPPGATAVVMKEQARSDGNGRVTLFHAPEPGEWIRPRAQDVREGRILLKAGTVLRPYEIALLAAQGLTRVRVRRKPKVAVLSTGDELIPASQPLRPGKIRDANGPSMTSALALWGIPFLDLGIVKDDPKRLQAKFKAALAKADAVVVSGGVSAGDFDLTKVLLEKLGLKTVFWKVKLKPGKPLLFGMKGPKPVFGLPGNPISVLVCLDEFVKPALERLQGRAPGLSRYHLQGKALNGFELPRQRRQLLFCEAALSGGTFKLRILRPQASHMMARCSQANALALPPGAARRIKPGDSVPFRWLDW